MQRYIAIFDAENFVVLNRRELAAEFASRWPESPDDACTLYVQTDLEIVPCTTTTEFVSQDDAHQYFRTVVQRPHGAHEATINWDRKRTGT
jgi:hypothetical protein